ncbi:MAG: hypothetical protein ABSG05_00225 [Candidatus Pacearchaeota archaeon]|jgi:hypothetical protein
MTNEEMARLEEYNPSFYTTLVTATNIHYAEQIMQGYRWRNNCQPSEAQHIANLFASSGLDVFVGDIAFDCSGKREDMKAILTKVRSAQ